MAKKKAAAKKTAAKVKPAEKATVASIVAECKAEVLKGLGGKSLSKEAAAHWKGLYEKSITKKLQMGDTWEADKKNALPVARKLGKVAAALTTGKTVKEWAAVAAAEAISHDPGCPGIAQGGWCESA